MDQHVADTTFRAEYEIVYYDRKGRVDRTKRIVCKDDDDALETLARVRHANALELWDGNRLVWRFDARPLG